MIPLCFFWFGLDVFNEEDTGGEERFSKELDGIDRGRITGLTREILLTCKTAEVDV